jgi:lysophospholipase L1-like esterase
MNTTKIISTLVLAAAPLFATNQSSYTYLALGDSVPFGMNVTLLPPYSTQVPTASEFIGYPETVAALENLLNSGKEVNAACPGETSGSFLNINVRDNGCNFPHPEPPPLQPIPPAKPELLHTPYTAAQMDFALWQLAANKHINLVTLSIGANDILLVLPQLEQCLATSGCDPETILGPVLGNYASNLVQILTRIRSQYHGTLILMTYYSPAPALDTVTQALNGTMLQVASQLNAQPGFPQISIADGYTAFRAVSAPFGGDACQAGLLIKLPPGPFTTTPCDIHPSPLGRDILAATVVLAQGISGR